VVCDWKALSIRPPLRGASALCAIRLGVRKEDEQMNNVLNDLSPTSLATAIKTNLFDWYCYLGRAPNVEYYHDLHLTWMLTGIPMSFLNVVFRTHLPPGGEDKIIDETLALFKVKRVTRLWWFADPGNQDADLIKRLVAKGLTFGEGSPGMASDLLKLQDQPPQVPGLTIVPVTTKETLKQWVRTMWIGYELPDSGENIFFDVFANLGFDLPLRSYIAFQNEEPVAASQLFLSAGVGGIYCVATVPKGRRQGIGAAITLAPLRDARQMGYRVGILQSSQMGYPVYSRLGFQEYCKMSRCLLTE
jgi:GNAT superfamily N-acetyltransferase